MHELAQTVSFESMLSEKLAKQTQHRSLCEALFACFSRNMGQRWPFPCRSELLLLMNIKENNLTNRYSYIKLIAIFLRNKKCLNAKNLAYIMKAQVEIRNALKETIKEFQKALADEKELILEIEYFDPNKKKKGENAYLSLKDSKTIFLEKNVIVEGGKNFLVDNVSNQPIEKPLKKIETSNPTLTEEDKKPIIKSMLKLFEKKGERKKN